jgi:sugar phosphate isomerase/epimerase
LTGHTSHRLTVRRQLSKSNRPLEKLPTNTRGGTPTTNPLALQLYTVRSEAEISVRGTLERIKKLGYGAVETAGLYGLRPTDMREELGAADLRLCGSHIPLPGPSEVSEALGQVVELASPVAISSLQAANFADHGSVCRAADRLNVLVDPAQDLGLKIGYHNHWWEFSKLPDGTLPYDVLVDHLDPRVVLEVDTYWALVGGVDPASLIQAREERVRYLHVKDGPIDETAPHVAVGQGKVNVPRILSASRSIDWYVVELDESDGDIWEALESSVAYLETLRS